MKQLAGIIALLAGVGFSYASIQLAVSGTGMEVPEDVVGTVGEGELHESPAGQPFLYGEVRLARSGSQAFEQSWSATEGDPEVVVDGETYRFPAPDRWQGLVPADTVEVQSVAGLPVVGAIEEEARERMQPPYVVIVKAIRPGDQVALDVEGDQARVVYVGELDELRAWHDQREGERWPIVIMLGVLGLASLGLGWRVMRPKT